MIPHQHQLLCVRTIFDCNECHWITQYSRTRTRKYFLLPNMHHNEQLNNQCIVDDGFDVWLRCSGEEKKITHLHSAYSARACVSVDRRICVCVNVYHFILTYIAYWHNYAHLHNKLCGGEPFQSRILSLSLSLLSLLSKCLHLFSSRMNYLSKCVGWKYFLVFRAQSPHHQHNITLNTCCMCLVQ